MNDNAKHIVDGLAVSATVATLMAWLPPIAAALTIIWTVIRIAESETAKRVYTWVKSRLA
jgi:hypothetical protein